MRSVMSDFKEGDLVYIPSGLGGVLPAVVLFKDIDSYQVRCIHQEFYPMWLLSVKNENIKRFDGLLTKTEKASYLKIISKPRYLTKKLRPEFYAMAVEKV